MRVETLIERIKHILNRPITLKPQKKTASPMKHADDMLSTAIIDLNKALEEGKKKHET